MTEQSRRVPETPSHGSTSIPGIFLKYDIEPVLLTVSEEWGGILGLLLRCVNVIAGVIVAGGWLVSLQDWAADLWGRRGRRRSSSVGGLLHGKGEKEGMQ